LRLRRSARPAPDAPVNTRKPAHRAKPNAPDQTTPTTPTKASSPSARQQGNKACLGEANPRIPRCTQRFRDLYLGRAAVEREFGRLKHDYGLSPLRVRGLERVALHADLTMLARLAQALSRARAVARAA